MRFLINRCYGGFGISDKAFEWLIENKNWKVYEYDSNVEKLYIKDCEKLIKKGFRILKDKKNPYSHFISSYSILDEDMSELELRSNIDLIDCFIAIGEEFNSRYSKVKLVSIDTDITINELEIDEYDGLETLQTIPSRFV